MWQRDGPCFPFSCLHFPLPNETHVHRSLSRFARIFLSCLLIVLSTTLSGVASADPYTDAFADAQALETAGRFADASAALEAIRPSYPQDYALTLQLAWLAFQAERYEEAEGHYRFAIDLSDGAVDAELGLGWTLLRQGDSGGARQAFDGVLARSPGHSGALEGIAALDAQDAVEDASSDLLLSASSTAHIYPSNPNLDWAMGGAAGIGYTPWTPFFVGATYRFTYFQPPGSGATGAGRWDPTSSAPGYSQNELYTAAGLAWAEAAVIAQYALIIEPPGSDGSSTVEPSSGRGRIDAVHNAGLMLR